MAKLSSGPTFPISISRHTYHHRVTACHVATPTTTTTIPFADLHPSLEVIGGARNRFLPALHSALRHPYDPFPFIAWNPHVETIFASFFRSIPDVRLRRECLRTQDGGTVALDWVAGDQYQLPPDSPILILMPGLTGGSENSYPRHMLTKARSKGWRVVVFNSRGCGNSPVTTPQFYSASFVGDMREVVEHVSGIYPEANLYAAAWSLGANILVRYLGDESHACPLSGAVSLCNPFNLVYAFEEFTKGFNRVYDKALARSIRNIFKRHILLFEDIGGEYNIPLALNARQVRDFDEGLTRVSFGFKSLDEYYYKASCFHSIKHVQVPLLCIQAANDPISPVRAIPREEIEANRNCLLIVTPKGGHLGWVAGADAPLGGPWTDPVVMDFLEHLERGTHKTVESSTGPLTVTSKNLHHAEV
ncbi:hypothetical protein ERO13_A11G018800v2 [Gossypium hirsutum]|uniref:Embryogenesis-associated protein EMB8 n=1 Tax=Gossypium hirsutum TaxID=3635 RepID=A0A1U8L6B1_GOSHI|nr:embryogenesis-associated protein EMB8 [Gossypium hirsutum]KAG4172779.1 hypothetical protein ERO13_A11G018800v2 [Gossypium hirsutum]